MLWLASVDRRLLYVSEISGPTCWHSLFYVLAIADVISEAPSVLGLLSLDPGMLALNAMDIYVPLYSDPSQDGQASAFLCKGSWPALLMCVNSVCEVY